MIFERSDVLAVHTQAELALTLGPVALYRYRHQALERWQDGRFLSLDTQTNDNGRVQHVRAWRDNDFVSISTGASATTQAARDALPFTHWNRAIAKAALFNPQDGRLLRETVAAPVAGSVILADGSRRSAESVAFRGDAYIDDWYDGDGVWTGLIGRLKDGSMLEYRRL